MAADEPPYLTVGTDVSAKYKGAFCEAKIKKVNRIVKCKVTFKNNQGSAMVPDDQIKGPLRIGAEVEARHPDKSQFLDAIINKMQDYSQYTVVFDDGDETTLRRTSLCLKSGRHFAESPTLDQFPLTNPEHFGTPVIGTTKSKRKRRSTMNSAALEYYSSDDEIIPKKVKPSKSKEKDPDIGKIVCVDFGDKRKKDTWYPGLVVANATQDGIKINTKEEYLIRSFKDGKYYTVPKRDTREFTREIGRRVDNNTLRTAVEKALLYFDKGELPPHWDKTLYTGSETASADEDSHDSDTDTSDDEPSEEKDRFVAQLYKYMEERGTPINKAPTVGNRDLSLYKLFKVVHKMGGCNRVTNQNKWKVVYTKMNLPTTNTAGTNQIKVAYKRYLHSFEDFYRKLGCTMVTNSRSTRGRHRSDRNFIITRNRDKDASSPKPRNLTRDKSVDLKAEDKINKKEEREGKIKVESNIKVEEKPKVFEKKRVEKLKMEDREEKSKLKKDDNNKPKLIRSQSLVKEKQENSEEKKESRNERAKAREDAKKGKPETPEKKKETRSTVKIELIKKTKPVERKVKTESKEPEPSEEKYPKDEKTVTERKDEKKTDRPVRDRTLCDEKLKKRAEEKTQRDKKDMRKEKGISTDEDSNSVDKRDEEDKPPDIELCESKFSPEDKKSNEDISKEVKLMKEDTVDLDDDDTDLMFIKETITIQPDEQQTEKDEKKEIFVFRDTCEVKIVKAETESFSGAFKKIEAKDSMESTDGLSHSEIDDDFLYKDSMKKHDEMSDGKEDSKLVIDLSDSDDGTYSTCSDKNIENKDGKERQIEVGDKVKVKYGRGRQQKVYEAKVLKIEMDNGEKRYYVHYAGWNMRYDEWIRKNFIVENLTERNKTMRQRKQQELLAKGDCLSSPKKGDRGRPPGASPSKLSRKNSTSSTNSSTVSSSRTTRSDKTSLQSSPFSKGLLPRRRTRKKSGMSLALTDTSQDSESDEDVLIYHDDDDEDEDVEIDVESVSKPETETKEEMFSDEEEDKSFSLEGFETQCDLDSKKTESDSVPKKEDDDDDVIEIDSLEVKSTIPSSNVSSLVESLDTLIAEDSRKLIEQGFPARVGFGTEPADKPLSDKSKLSTAVPIQKKVPQDSSKMFLRGPLIMDSKTFDLAGSSALMENKPSHVMKSQAEQNLPPLLRFMGIPKPQESSISLMDMKSTSAVKIEKELPKFAEGSRPTPKESSFFSSLSSLKSETKESTSKALSLGKETAGSEKALNFSKFELGKNTKSLLYSPHSVKSKPQEKILSFSIMSMFPESTALETSKSLKSESQKDSSTKDIVPGSLQQNFQLVDPLKHIAPLKIQEPGIIPSSAGHTHSSPMQSSIRLDASCVSPNPAMMVEDDPIKTEEVSPFKGVKGPTRDKYQDIIPFHKYLTGFSSTSFTQKEKIVAPHYTVLPQSLKPTTDLPKSSDISQNLQSRKEGFSTFDTLKNSTFSSASTPETSTEVKSSSQTSVIAFAASSATTVAAASVLGQDIKADAKEKTSKEAMEKKCTKTEVNLGSTFKTSAIDEKQSVDNVHTPLISKHFTDTKIFQASEEEVKIIEQHFKCSSETAKGNYDKPKIVVSPKVTEPPVKTVKKSHEEAFATSQHKIDSGSDSSVQIAKDDTDEDSSLLKQNLEAASKINEDMPTEASTSDSVATNKDKAKPGSSVERSPSNDNMEDTGSIPKKEGRKKKSKMGKWEKKNVDPSDNATPKLKEGKFKSKKKKLDAEESTFKFKDSESKGRTKKLKKNKNKKRFQKYSDDLNVTESTSKRETSGEATKEAAQEKMKRKEKRKKDDKKTSKFDFKSREATEGKEDSTKKKKGRKTKESNKTGDKKTEVGDKKIKKKKRNRATEYIVDTDSEKEIMTKTVTKKTKREKKKPKAKDTSSSDDTTDGKLMIDESKNFPSGSEGGAEKKDKQDDPDMSFLLCEEKVPASPVNALPEETSASSSIDDGNNNRSPSSDDDRARAVNMDIYPRQNMDILEAVNKHNPEACAVLDNTPPTTPSSTESIPSSSPSHDRESFLHYTESTQSGRESGEGESDSFHCESNRAEVTESEEYRAAATLAFAVCQSVPQKVPISSRPTIKRQKSETDEPSPSKRKRKSKRSYGASETTKPGHPRVKGIGSRYNKGDGCDVYDSSGASTITVCSPPRDTNSVFSTFSSPSSQQQSLTSDLSCTSSFKSGKSSFHFPLHEYKDPEKRISVLQDKMSELRKLYASLKAEVATIDRRRKKARKKIREAAGQTQINTSAQPEEGQNIS